MDDEIPTVNVFDGIDVSNMEPGRTASLLENYFYTDRSVTRATRDFIPRGDDVVCACNPRTGDALLIRILRLIMARDDEEYQLVRAEPTNSTQVPWIESRFVDGDLELLQKPQPGSRRIFKTHMAHQGLNVGSKNAPLYISLLRHPVDVRLSFFRYVRDCHRVGGNQPAFESVYCPDDFVEVSVTTGQILPHAKILTYEHTILDWFQTSQKNPRVLTLFYERLVTHPKEGIRALAEFTECAIDAARIDDIVSLVSNEQLLPGGLGSRENRVSFSEENGLEYSWDSCERMKKKWKRALESVQLPPKTYANYEEFYFKETSEEYPWPKEYPPKPLKNGPLDKFGRDVEARAKKCVIS